MAIGIIEPTPGRYGSLTYNNDTGRTFTAAALVGTGLLIETPLLAGALLGAGIVLGLPVVGQVVRFTVGAVVSLGTAVISGVGEAVGTVRDEVRDVGAAARHQESADGQSQLITPVRE